MKKISYKFFLNSEKEKNGNSPLYLRITVDRKNSLCSLGYNLNPKQWDSAKQRANKHSHLVNEINEDLNNIEIRLITIQKDIERNNGILTASAMKDMLTGKNSLESNLIESFDKYKRELTIQKVVKPISIKRYDETKNHLINFLSTKKVADINVKQVNYQFIKDFDLFLSETKIKNSEQCIDVNTRNKHHSRLRTILLQSIKEGYITINPYGKFPLVNKSAQVTYLLDTEVERIIKHDLAGNKSLQRIRDIFVFSCFTALRFEDAQNITMEDIVIDEKGKYWLKTKQAKTSDFLGIPILKQAVDIIKKYENSPERIIKNRILPTISNKSFNVYIKEIAILVGIDKHLHHHVARHSCATLLLSKGYSLEQVATWLGHRSTGATRRYAKITGASLDKIRNELDNE